MKRLILFFNLLALSAGAQNVINNQVTIGNVDSLYSVVMQEKQTFWVSLPTSYYNPHVAKAHYPVIYVLDGDANFATVSAMVKQLSVRNGNSILPEFIVVGVMNNKRSRDFTPYKSSFWIYDTPSPLEVTGGGEKFIEFIQKELIPYIDANYPTKAYRLLIGHSLGGLAAANILINHTSIFNAYIIIDPSMWFDNQRFLRKAQQMLQQPKFKGISVYLGMANNLPRDMDTAQLLKDIARGNLHMRSVFEFRNSLRANSTLNGMYFNYGYYNNDTHMSSPLISTYDGLRFIFDYYPLPMGTESMFFDPNDKTDPAPMLKSHFEQVSKHIGFQILPPESLILIWANSMNGYGNSIKALSLYRLNVAIYPQSYHALENLGDFYAKQKDNENAIACYQDALKIKDEKEIKDKLVKLQDTNAKVK